MPKFHIGRPLEGDSSSITGWDFMKTLDQRRLFLSIGIGIFLSLLVAAIWLTCYPDSLSLGSPSWSEFALALLVLSLGHEALHLLGFPRFGLDSNTVIGVWPEFGSPYVQYLSPMRRNRFLFATILPFLVLTILPILVSIGLPGFIDYASWISVLNSIGAGSDIFIFVKVTKNISKDSFVMENHDSIYWGRFNTLDELSNSEKNMFQEG